MRSLTFTRGVWLACAITLLLALTAAPALAAGSPSHHAAGSSAASRIANAQTKSLAAKYGANSKLNLHTGTAAHATTSSGISGSIVRTIVGLLIVIAVIYGLTWIVKQSKASKNPAVGDGLEQVASLPLGTNRSVALVRVGDELHLLGVAEHGITGIRVFSEDEAYELGLPFHSDDGDYAGRGPVPVQRVVDALRRITLR